MTDAEGSASPPSALGRLLFGGTLVYMSIDGFRNNEKRVEIARGRGVPMPELLVPLATGLLLVASLLLVLWAWPVLAAAGILAFFVTTTPSIHAFWEDEGKERANQQIHFSKNIALIGATVVFLREVLRNR